MRHRRYKQRHYKKKQKHSPRNDCGYRRPRFCRHEFLRESTAEAFALVRPIKFDRRTKGRVTLIGTDSAERHVLRQLEKTIFRPATRCHHKEMRIDSHAASASDAPMPTHVPQIGQAAETLGASQLADHTETVETGICKSRSTASGGSRWMRSTASRPFVASTTRCPRPPGVLQSSALDRMAESVQTTSVQVALAWLFQRSPNILLIPDTSSTSHLREGVTRNFWKGQSHPSLSILGNLPRKRSRGH